MMEQAEKRITGANAGEAMMAMREKNWSEIGIEEKVERLRHELRRQREVVEYAARTATKALELAQQHQHGAHGQVLVAADDRANRIGAAEAGRSFDALR